LHDGQAVRLVLVTDHVAADLMDKLVIRIELEQLRLPGVCALKDPGFESRATAGTPPKPEAIHMCMKAA
jgi:hypothetical protein